MPEVEIGGQVVIGGNRRIAVIAGPCVIESERHCLAMAGALKESSEKAGLPLVFKASFDKANRSSLRSYRGPGLAEGLRILGRIKTETGLAILSDIHEASQAAPASRVLDVLQIPALLCRQTDLLLAAAATGLPVNVKKGQFLSPWETANIVEKLRASGNGKILLTERGTTFGYQNLVVDFRSIPIMKSFDCPVVFDATHSVQRPGLKGDSSGGDRAFISTLARAGVASGADALFVEVHDRPDQALSDGSNSLPLGEFESLLDEVRRIGESLGRTR
ncbi:MAG TPA: 3-deoxy-8-phosphooctulonate synthase [Candidatus Polarisedimenticolia bacterium]|nr:3-deoxy-8-phosphooctulonate synthase [Candidatus Polarisedimenticolia bacterium]